jgi:hypothetical protein
VAVDHAITVRLSRNRNDDDRHLLAGVGQRSQKPPLASRAPNPKVSELQIQLVKLEVDRTGHRVRLSAVTLNS